MPDDTIHFKFTELQVKALVHLIQKDVTLELEGDANDYFGKGLSGAKLIIYPSKEATLFRKKISLSATLLFMVPLPAKHL